MMTSNTACDRLMRIGTASSPGASFAILISLLQVFFFQAEDGIRDLTVTGVQTCALPIFTRNRYAAGVAAKVDVVQAETQLKSTQAQAIDTGVQRAQLEHAIAVLIGKLPSEDRKSVV